MGLKKKFLKGTYRSSDDESRRTKSVIKEEGVRLSVIEGVFWYGSTVGIGYRPCTVQHVVLD